VKAAGERGQKDENEHEHDWGLGIGEGGYDAKQMPTAPYWQPDRIRVTVSGSGSP
jgi:hypothetical protein